MDENNALIVDDDKNLGDLLRDILQDEGFSVTCCRSGEEALEAAEKKLFRIIITDYRMPGMYGTELARVLRSRLPRAFIIGISLDCMEQEFLAAGADVFMPKTFHISELISLLERSATGENGGGAGKIRDTSKVRFDIPETA